MTISCSHRTAVSILLQLLLLVSQLEQVKSSIENLSLDADSAQESTPEAADDRKRVVQLTDIHYCLAASSKEGSASDNVYCSNDSLITSALTAANSHINVQYFAITGDFLLHPEDMPDTTYERRMETLSKAIKGIWNKAPVIPVFGASDAQPANVFPDEECMTYKTLFTIWKDYIGDENSATFLRGGYYKKQVSSNVIVIALNTDLYSASNEKTFNFTDKTDPAGQFKFLEDTLKNEKNQSHYVHIIGHIPPGASKYGKNKDRKLLLPEYNKRLNEIIIQYSDVIKLILFGYEHMDSFRLFKVTSSLIKYTTQSDDTVQVAFLTPSLSPGGNENDLARKKNPAFRVFEFDNTFEKLRAIRRLVICAMENVDYDLYDKCVAEAPSGMVLQLTDFHYDEFYSIYGEPSSKNLCHNTTLNSNATNGEYGDYMCDANEVTIRRYKLILHMLNYVKKTPNLDYIFWTGDNFPHIENYTIEALENTIKKVTGFVQEAFPHTLVLPTFGNHDYSPANAFPDNGSILYDYVYELWKHWITEENKETFLRGGYYKYKIKDKVIILVLNTNLYYQPNKAYDTFANKSDPAGQFKFMFDTLEDAKASNSTVHVVAHIAPGVFERTPSFKWMHREYNEKFIKITVKYASVISSMIFGHHHTDTFHIVKDPESKPVQVYFMAPALTPWFSSLKGAGSNNPSYRILKYDTTLKKLSDMEYLLPFLLQYIRCKILYKYSETIYLLEQLAQLCSIEFPQFSDYDNCMHGSSTANGNPFSQLYIQLLG
uniref:Metallophos domain-containing protein n=1 Tax=Syphacia muris TaxID=451379 RepID=A0A0N5ASH1_9BILA